MSLWRIAWKSIRHRGLASALTALSMALGVMLVVSVLSIHGVVAESFHNNTTLGYNMIVGAKGGSLQLTLNTVYYLSRPIENVPYSYFLEFQDREYRDKAWENSYKYREFEAQRDSIRAHSSVLGLLGAPGAQTLGALLAEREMDSVDRATRLDLGRDGQFKPYVQFAIPMCMGDYFGRFRVVGTTPALLDRLIETASDDDLRIRFAQGRNFHHYSEENGFYEAVVGAVVAREHGIRLGDRISPAHGAQDGHTHENEFTVVGILASSGTPHDRGVFVNMEGFYLMDDHAKPVPVEQAELDEVSADSASDSASDSDAESADAAAGGGDEGIVEDHADGEAGPARGLTDPAAHVVQPLPVESREVTSMLVLTQPLVGPRFQNMIDEGQDAQAALPIHEIYNLFSFFVRPIQYALLALTVMICIVSGISILVSIYNSMSERRHEIAVMRALGASRGTVMSVILLESIFLALGGGLLGWMMGHVLNVVASPEIERRTGVALGFLDTTPPISLSDLLGMTGTIGRMEVYPELLLIPSLMLLAVIVGFIPALAAYRTDVSKSLGK